jgi:hypothetical protein
VPSVRMISWLSSVPAWWAPLLALSVASASAPTVVKQHPFQAPLPSREARLAGPATRAANLSPAACRSRLQALDSGHSIVRAGETKGIATSVRITGPLGDLKMRVPGPKLSYGLLDCRLAVILLELAPELSRAGVRALNVDGFYRKGARLGGKKGKKSQHAYGLAIDLVTIEVTDPATGQPVVLDVPRDFYGQRGEPPCGPDARLHPPDSATAADVRRSVLLRNFVCQLARDGWFHHILTPNHDAAHESHLHLDIKRDSRWLSID